MNAVTPNQIHNHSPFFGSLPTHPTLHTTSCTLISLGLIVATKEHVGRGDANAAPA
jgi:hypothetical protein